MGMTLTQFSNLLNLMTQAETRLKFYHFGWRSDININPQNNYNPDGVTGRLYPALHLDIPDYLTYQDEPQPNGVQEKARINLYFDTLQGTNNDGSLNAESMLEQFTSLKKISEDFMSNLVVLLDHYGYAFLDTKPTFTPRANMHNDKLITIEVAFDLMLQVECTEVAYQVDVNDFPISLDVADLERVIGNPPTRCQRITSELTQDDLLYCILPLYDFSDPTTQSALSAQQLIDLGVFLLPLYDFSDPNILALLTAQQIEDLSLYILPLIDFSNPAIQALLTVQQKEDLTTYLLPFVDFSDPTIQALITSGQQSDLITWLCPTAPTKYTFFFDGINEKINGTNSPNMQFDKNTPFSICAWVKTTNNGLLQTVIAKRGTLGTNYWGLFIRGGLCTLIMRDNLANDYFLEGTTTTLMANTWYHLAVSYDGDLSGAGTIIKVNNVLQSKAVTGMPTGTLINTQVVSIGGSNSNNAYMSGWVGYIRVWNTNVVDSTIVTDYNGGEMNNNVSEQANLVLDWSSATDALFNGTNWVSKDRTNNMENPSLVSVNMEFADKTTDIPT